MRVVIAPDSFKECATAVAEALARDIRRVWREADLALIPMADAAKEPSMPSYDRPTAKSSPVP